MTSAPVIPSRSAGRQATALLYVSAQFFVLTIAAMFAYPGGAFHQPQATHYEFTRNFFSDLGATHTSSGKTNLTSQVLFIFALSSIGLGLVLTSSVWKNIGRRPTGLATAAQAFAVVSGVCFVGIAATPWNILGREHMFFVKLGFTLLLGLMGSMVLLQQKNSWPGAYIACNWTYVVLLVVYVWILFYGPSLHTESGVEFQVVAQKIIVYASIANLAIQACGLKRESPTAR